MAKPEAAVSDRMELSGVINVTDATEMQQEGGHLEHLLNH